MYKLLFAEPAVDRLALRTHARKGLLGSALIRACAAGDELAIHALLRGFWPFVQGFERAIDMQVKKLPLRTLIMRFGQERIKRFFADARLALSDMRDEEGSHAALWLEGATAIGLDLAGVEPVKGVQALLDNAETPDPVEFFCWLAGTEYVAEEMAAYLCRAPAFLDNFPDRRWRWGEAHAIEHDGISHLAIDEDLARAYHPASDPVLAGVAMSAQLRRCHRLFAAAAADVLAKYRYGSETETRDSAMVENRFG
ncbi:MAG: hypothetical protein JO095_10470 [Alphaproteobacteria bacterium]|nr:hypothetical protein [Alphaproteobacteria bacterium]